jgi:hypothetical protein
MPVLAASITEDAMLTALRGFLLDILPPGVEVFQAQNNRVPEPAGVDFIVMTPKSRVRQATNEDTWPADDVDPAAIDRAQSTRVTIQLDVHGPAGSDTAQIIGTVWRDEYGTAALAGSGIVPLYADDGQQMPFINGEKQYENRWVMAVAFQATPVVSTPQDFADNLAIDLRGLT